MIPHNTAFTPNEAKLGNLAQETKHSFKSITGTMGNNIK